MARHFQLDMYEPAYPVRSRRLNYHELLHLPRIHHQKSASAREKAATYRYCTSLDGSKLGLTLGSAATGQGKRTRADTKRWEHLIDCFVLFCFVLFCFVLFCSVLFCSVLFCSVLFCSVLFCSVCHVATIEYKMK
jgi:hypothetical protein